MQTPTNGEPQSFRAYALSELPEPEPTTWILEGYLGKGLKTELVGVWKGGKTTFVAELLRSMKTGDKMARQAEDRAARSQESEARSHSPEFCILTPEF